MNVIASFDDASIVMWHSQTFDVAWKVYVRNLTPDLNASILKGERAQLNYPRVTAFAVSKDNEILVYYGLYFSVFVLNDLT